MKEQGRNMGKHSKDYDSKQGVKAEMKRVVMTWIYFESRVNKSTTCVWTLREGTKSRILLSTAR